VDVATIDVVEDSRPVVEVVVVLVEKDEDEDEDEDELEGCGVPVESASTRLK
jgi:hypothetical protein